VRRISAEVVVVGAGPAGAALSWALARGGRDVVVLDRATFPRPKACAEYISPEACRLLEAMGVLPAVLAAGPAQLAGMLVRAPDGTQLVGEFGSARERVSRHTMGIALRRERLDALLVQAAQRAGATLCEGAHVRDVRRGADGRVTGVQLGDGAEVRGRIVIGADGLNSVVARRLALGVRARWPRRVAFVAHFADVLGMGVHGEMHVDCDGYVGLAPVDAGLVNVALVLPTVVARAHTGSAADLLSGWIAGRPHLASRFVVARRETEVRAAGPFGWRTRRAWAPGAALVGDAADFFDPFTGEGIYAALRGAELLAPYVHAAAAAATQRSETEALTAYDRARRHEFGGKWTVERLVGCAVGWAPLMNRAARGLSRRRDLADTLVGVTGDVVPAAAVLRPRYLLALANAALS
jgi:flavin-dependent dehydrogenase